MEPLNIDDLPSNALLLVDTAPIIYTFEGRIEFVERFRTIFKAYEDGEVELAVTTVTIAEVLTGPMQVDDDFLVGQYRDILESWRVVPLDADIALRVASIRAKYRLKLPDAVQAASAIAINADALVTHDRDFSRLRSLRVIS
jgi:predicted nucleic acid-binding protein